VPGDQDGLTEDNGSFRIGFIRDSLDDANFPSSGGRLDTLVLLNRDVLGADGEGEIFDLIWDHAASYGPNRLLFGTRVHTTWGEPSLFDGVSALGGFTNLSGYRERQLLDQHSFLMRGIYYRRLGDDGRLFSVPAFVGGSLETGNVFATRDDLLDLEDLVLGGSLFVGVDSPLGPIFLGYGRNDDGESSVYLNFGSLLRPRL
jgi:NTE family protein